MATKKKSEADIFFDQVQKELRKINYQHTGGFNDDDSLLEEVEKHLTSMDIDEPNYKAYCMAILKVWAECEKENKDATHEVNKQFAKWIKKFKVLEEATKELALHVMPSYEEDF